MPREDLGWISHILVDVAIRPIINSAVGERIRGDSAFPDPWYEDSSWHLRVEIGVDGVWWAEQTAILKPSWPDCMLFETIADIMHWAFAASYGRAIVSKDDVSRTVSAGYANTARLGEFTIVDGCKLLSRKIPRGVRGTFWST